MRKLLRVIGILYTTIGIAGIPDDVQGWSIWLSMLEPYINNYLVRVMLVLCGLAAITYPQWLPTFKKWRRNRNEEASTAPFDMPIRDAVNHLIMTVPYSSEIPSQPNLRKQTVMEILHRSICNGDMPIWGSLDGLTQPIRIPARKCRKLTPRIKHVPQSSASPESIRFSLFALPESGNEDDPFVEYSNLWICSSDLYRLWPEKP